MRKLIIALCAVAPLAAAVAAQTTDGGTATASAPVAAAPAAADAGAADAPSPADQARRAELLAKVGDHVLTVGDFEDQLSSPAIPAPVRAGYASPERLKEEFDERVERMAMAQWAIHDGLDRRADIRREVRKLYRGITLYREIRDSITEASINDADVAAYYEQHSALYNRPETVNAAMILFADRAQAEAALPRALAAKGSRADLTKLVRELSTDPDTKRRGGSLGFFDRDGKLNRPLAPGETPPAPVDPALVTAAFTLTDPFDVYTQVVDGTRGPAIVFLINRTAAVSRSVDEVAPRIRIELLNERRDAARDRLLAEARDRYHVQVLDANFEHVVIAPSPSDAMMEPHGGMLDGPPGMMGPPGPPSSMLMPPPGAPRPPSAMPAPGAPRPAAPPVPPVPPTAP